MQENEKPFEYKCSCDICRNASCNCVVDIHLEIIVYITKDTQEDYEINWRKVAFPDFITPIMKQAFNYK